MNITTFEGVVEQGQIRLKSNIRLPEKIRVYVVIPDLRIEQVAHVFTPRLAHPEQAAEFKLEIIEDPANANV